MSLTVTFQTRFKPVRHVQQPVGARRPVVSRTARMLALAHHVEDLVERVVLRDYADAARRLGMTRARMSQVMDLLMLAPGIQEGILTGRLSVSERALRAVLASSCWRDQTSHLGRDAGIEDGPGPFADPSKDHTQTPPHSPTGIR